MTWLTVKEVAALLSVSERAVQLSIKKTKYDCRYVNGVGRGGKQLQISLESLPEEVQAHYRGEQVKHTSDILLSLTEAQRNVVFKKQTIVLAYKEFRRTYSKADKMRAFLNQYNEQNQDNPLTKRQLNHWESLYDQDGVAGLVDRRGGYNKGQSSIPEDVRKVFLAYWMQEKGNRRGGGPSIASCYRLTQFSFPNQELPSIAAFQRMTQSIPYPAKVLGREGKKAYADKCEPFIPFDYRSICTNQVWCADNHVFDLWVKDGERVFKPHIIGWMDKRSRYIVGYLLTDYDPNSYAILDAFARSVYACGIPDKVHLDNGKDYTVHDLFNRDFALSLANEMSIQVSNAIPYNAKSKLIERFFNTLEYSYCIHLPSYFGSDPQRRPDKLKKSCDELKDEAIPYNEFKVFIENVIATYNNRVHEGDAMDGKTPFQAFKDFIVKPIRVAEPTLLSMYFKRTSRILTVGRNGIRVPELKHYYNSEDLFEYQRKKIYARYNTDDVRQVYCFTEDGEFICKAENIDLGTLDQELTAQNMRKINAKKKQLRKQAKAYIPDISIPSTQRIAMENGFSFDKPDLKVLPTTPIVNSSHHKKAKAIRIADQKDKPNGNELLNGDALRKRDEAYWKHLDLIGGI